MTTVPRYYAQALKPDPVFRSAHITPLWQVYDRDLLTPEGEVRAIAFCVSRETAFAIRDALNETDR